MKNSPSQQQHHISDIGQNQRDGEVVGKAWQNIQSEHLVSRKSISQSERNGGIQA